MKGKKIVIVFDDIKENEVLDLEVFSSLANA